MDLHRIVDACKLLRKAFFVILVYLGCHNKRSQTVRLEQIEIDFSIVWDAGKPKALKV